MKLTNELMPIHAKRKLLMVFREISVPRIITEERNKEIANKYEVEKRVS